MLATLLLIRHAETAGNLSGADAIMSGCTDLPLTTRGVKQARALGARLAEEPPPLVIYSSPLERALRTASIVAECLGREISLVPALREIDCGFVDGWPLRKVQQYYPREWARNKEQVDPDFRWPGGESYREFRERILHELRAIADRHVRERVMIVTHAGVISQIMGWRLGVTPARWDGFRPRNTSVTELRVHAGGSEVVRFDDCGASDCGEPDHGEPEPGESARAGVRPAQDA